MQENSYEGAERRSVFRLKYDQPEKPVFKVRKHQFQVMDVCEKGIRLRLDDPVRLVKWVRGALTFAEGDEYVLEGKIVWEQDGDLGLQLVTRLPYKTVLKEQRKMLKRR
jgi:hypothetical protein